MHFLNPQSRQQVPSRRVSGTRGALIIRIGFWGPLYNNYNKEPPNCIGSLGNYLYYIVLRFFFASAWSSYLSLFRASPSTQPLCHLRLEQLFSACFSAQTLSEAFLLPCASGIHERFASTWPSTSTPLDTEQLVT